MSQEILRPKSSRIAFVQSCWHRDIVDQARDSFLTNIAAHGMNRNQVDCYEVPGAFESPLHAKLLAESGHYAAIVATAVIDALMRVQLETRVPVLSLVLTPQNFHEHEEHRGFFKAHFVTKGAEAAQACAQTIRNIEKLREAAPLLRSA